MRSCTSLSNVGEKYTLTRSFWTAAASVLGLQMPPHDHVQGIHAVGWPREDAGRVPELARDGDLAGGRWRMSGPWCRIRAAAHTAGKSTAKPQLETSRTAWDRGPSSSTPAGRPVARVIANSRLRGRGCVGGEGMSRGGGDGTAPAGREAGCGRWTEGVASGGAVGGSRGRRWSGSRDCCEMVSTQPVWDLWKYYLLKMDRRLLGTCENINFTSGLVLHSTSTLIYSFLLIRVDSVFAFFAFQETLVFFT
jgi:hypothetical protein